MDHSLGSPISPIDTESSIETESPSPLAAVTTASEPARTQSPQKDNWIPFTFRWYFLLVPITVSLSLSIAISLLVWYSQLHYGIGTDNGSSAILFGWRFTPTLLAVLYTQSTVILFEDAKRTEPFTRLAQAPPEGASAYGTVLQTPRAWWAILLDLLSKRKSVGKTSWCLICCAFINIMALFAISPLSSALLTSEEVVVHRPLDFSRITPKANAQLPLVANRETYFRTMSALMRNVSTSAWLSDTSLTLPFWPSTEEIQLGPELVSQYSSWTMETTSLHADLNCKDMVLESADLSPTPYSGVYDVLGHGPYKGVEPMLHFVLKSDDGCTYNISRHPADGQASAGGLTWSDTSTLYIKNDLFPLGGMPFHTEINATSPYARHSASKECANRDIIILNTPWAKDVHFEDMSGYIERNKTYQRSLDFRMKALLCQSDYSLESRNTSVSISRGRLPSINPMHSDSSKRSSITKALVDVPVFEKMALQNTWIDYFSQTSMDTDADRAMDGVRGPNADMTIIRWAPEFTGLGPLLGALYSFNVTRMLEDEGFVAEATRVKGRFFTECLREALDNPDAVETSIIEGEATMIEERVMVLKEIGIALAVLFFVSFILLVLILWISRLKHRPLNLRTEPSSALGHAMLVRTQSVQSSLFRRNHAAPRDEFHQNLRRSAFYTKNANLYTIIDDVHSSTIYSTPTQKPERWQPMVIRIRMLFALSIFLICVIVAVLVLNAFSAQSRLSQQAFIYEANVLKLGLSFSTFAPISIAPTVVSIVIGLWWDQLDSTIRILQPFIAMSRRPTPIRNGAGLTYRSKTWAGAALKAARNKHWMLLMVATGSVFCQILTVSMSALFERQTTNVSLPIMLKRTLEARKLPILTTIRTGDRPWSITQPSEFPWKALDELLLDPPKNWLLGAAIELSLNGSTPAWTYDGWSFIPIDLSSIGAAASAQENSNQGTCYPSNVTLTTPALRARLECHQIPEVRNTSTWLTPINKENGKQDSESRYYLPYSIFNDSLSNTSTFAIASEMSCCSNGTGDNLETAVVGYWSPVEASNFPQVDLQWPIPFVTKWIVGKPLQEPIDRATYLTFKDMPTMQAASCMPTIEAADATVVVEKDTGRVQLYEILGAIEPTDEAWSEVFIQRNLTDGDSTQRLNGTYKGPVNITTSYGVLFMGSMFKAANENRYTGERIYNKAFVIRDAENGMNMDLMTYSMYSLVEKDSMALLDYETLVANAERTFETFFQHFVSNGLSLDDGGLSYQKIGDNSMDAMGLPMKWNGSALPQHEYPSQNTNRTTEGQISNRVQVLHLNSVATYLSAALLVWLIATTVVVTLLQRRYTTSLVRDVQLIADVLVLVAGSDKLLRLLQERDVGLKKSGDINTMLGWFRGEDGEVRWGIEVVGGRDAVQWVDPPKAASRAERTST